MRRAARVDTNQSSIVDGLRAFGASVFIASALHGGMGDLIVGYRGRNYLLEVKDPSKPKADRAQTPDQVKFQAGWLGQYAVVETLEQAIAIISEV